MKHKYLLLFGTICGMALLTCACGQKTYEIKDSNSDSVIQINITDKTGKKLGFEYTGSKIAVGTLNDDGEMVHYSDAEIRGQIKELGRENSLDIVEENGLKINYSAHPSDDLSDFSEEYDEYVYTLSDEKQTSIGTVHILMNEEAFKNRLQHIQEEEVSAGLDIYSDGLNVQGLPSEDYLGGSIKMRWVPEVKKGYMIQISSPDYSFEDISCSIDPKKEIETDEEYYEAKKSEEEMAQYIADYTEESAKIEKIVPQDNIAGFGLLLYDDEGYLVSGVSLYDEDGNVISISEDTEHKWCYDEKGWVVRADTVDVPYTLSEVGYSMGDYYVRSGDLVPIK